MALSADPEKARLFLALWPQAGLQEQLARATRKLVRASGGRGVMPHNLHITLIFLGTIDSTLRLCVESVAAGVRVPAFTLSLRRVGYWPRPRILWLAPEETPRPLTRLVALLREGVARCGISADQRPFTPHLTLARKAQRAARASLEAPLEWSVDRFCLVRSRTYPDGVEYGVAVEWGLESAAVGVQGPAEY